LYCHRLDVIEFGKVENVQTHAGKSGNCLCMVSQLVGFFVTERDERV